jgi:NADH-quinone oxidoreductase subunit E
MFAFTETSETRIKKIMAKYPEDRKVSALLPLLTLAQAQEGYVTPEAMIEIGNRLGVSPAYVESVCTFYTMYYTKPVGKYVVKFCVNISCHLNGCDNLMEYTERKLGIKEGETTSDKKFTLLKEECLAACTEAPVMQVNNKYHVNMTPEKIDQVLESYK